MTAPKPTPSELLVLDGTAMLFRSYYSIRYQSPAGVEVGAMMGVSQNLAKICRRLRPKHVLIAFDAGQKTFRNDIDPRYKANRGAPPEDLIPQFDGVKKMVEALGFWQVTRAGFEADDIMATATAVARETGIRCRVRALDKDLWQVIDETHPGTWVEDPRTDQLVGLRQVEYKYGIPVTRLRDYFALVGDSSDNIPGAPGVGPKAAMALMSHYDSIDSMFAHPEDIASLSVRGAKSLRKKIEEGRDEIFLARTLVSLKYDVDIGCDASSLMEKSRWQGPLVNANELFQEFGFQGGLPALSRLAN